MFLPIQLLVSFLLIDIDEQSNGRMRHYSGQAMEQDTKLAIKRILEKRPSGVPVKEFPGLFKVRIL